MASDSDSSLPLAVWQTIERLCTDYEQRLRNGDTPDVAVLLNQVPFEARPVLQRELEAVASEYRLVQPVSSPADNSTQTHLGEAAAGVDTATVLGAPAADVPLLDQHPRYRLVRRLGYGRRCVIWQAEDRLIRRSVMLHCLPPELLRSTEVADRFSRLVQQVQSWHCLQIAAVYEVESFNGTTLIVGEDVDGTPLNAGGETLSVAAACAAIQTALQGVQFASQQGIAHGRLTPQSLVRRRDGAMLIVDYPLTVLDAAPDPQYSAPERLAGNGGDVRSDIYSLGCILGALLTTAGDTPTRLASVVEKMTAARPSDRYQSATEAAKALHTWSRTNRSSRPRQLWWAAMIPLCVFLAALWSWHAVQSQQRQSIATNDPHVEVTVKDGHVVSIRDPLEDRDYPLVGQRLIFAHAFTDRGLKLPLVDGTSMRLRMDGDIWTVIRAISDAEISAAGSWQQTPATASPVREPMPFQRTLDFREAHDLDLEGLRSWIRDLPREFMPVDINARVHCDPPRFSAVATRAAEPRSYKTRFAIGRERIHEEFQNQTSQAGLLVAAHYRNGGEQFVHQVWQTGDFVWGAWTHPLAELKIRLESWRQEHLRPVAIYCETAPASTGLPGVLLRPDEGLDWRVDFDLTAAQLEWKVKLAREKGWRPDALAAYDDGTSKGTLYSLITVSNPSAAEWDFRSDLTSEDLEAALSELRTRALCPKVITSESMPDGQPRYTVIWVEFAPPDRSASADNPVPSASEAPAKVQDESVGEIRRYAGFEPRSWITRCLFSPDGQRVLAISGQIREWETQSGKEVARYARTAPFSWGFDVSPDGRHVVIAGDDAQIHLYSRHFGRHLAHWPTGQGGPYGFGATFSPDGKYLVTWAHYGKGAQLWDWQERQRIREFPSLFAHWSCRISPDGKKVLTAGVHEAVRIWDLETGKLLQTLSGHAEPVADMVCTPDGQKAVTGSADKTLIVWDLETGQRIRVLTGHTAGMNRLAMAGDGRRVLSCAEDRTARLWDIETGQELGTLEANTDPGASPRVSDVQFSADGKYGLTSAFDGTVRHWRLPGLPTSTEAKP